MDPVGILRMRDPVQPHPLLRRVVRWGGVELSVVEVPGLRWTLFSRVQVVRADRNENVARQ